MKLILKMFWTLHRLNSASILLNMNLLSKTPQKLSTDSTQTPESACAICIYSICIEICIYWTLRQRYFPLIVLQELYTKLSTESTQAWAQFFAIITLLGLNSTYIKPYIYSILLVLSYRNSTKLYPKQLLKWKTQEHFDLNWFFSQIKRKAKQFTQQWS